jgi:hypothetical protein
VGLGAAEAVVVLLAVVTRRHQSIGLLTVS